MNMLLLIDEVVIVADSIVLLTILFCFVIDWFRDKYFFRQSLRSENYRFMAFKGIGSDSIPSQEVINNMMEFSTSATKLRVGWGAPVPERLRLEYLKQEN